MYINDLEQHLSDSQNGITICHVRLLLLLYADDVVVFANSASELQCQMDKLYQYCNKWKLRLNTSKSKIVVFRKRKLNEVENWHFGNSEIEVEQNIPYLGILFSSNGLFTQAQCKLADQAKNLFSF
jgi:hypothetical protein